MMNRQIVQGRRELNAVYEVSKTLATSLDVTKTFREALNFLLLAFDWRRGFVVLAEPGGRLRGLCSAGLSREEQQRLQFHAGEGIVGRVYGHGMPMVVPDVHTEPLFLNRTGGADQTLGTAVAMLVTPILADRKTLGVLTVDCLNPGLQRVFGEEMQLLKMVATLMGQALLLHRSVSEGHERMQDEFRRMHKVLKPERLLDQVVGVSQLMQEVFSQVHRVAPARTTVLLRGESGTGKEVIARAIHSLSPRQRLPFVRVNCAALTETLLESELFGHEKGAFTGAQGQRKGRFEQAHEGTLFLDEIGDISASFQAKLLRVLQEREFERVGGNASVKVDVRLVLATNRNLERMVQAGEFRADLYYRINVVSIQLPPLRERREDIPAMAQHFLDRFNKENARHASFSEAALQVLSKCYWPGNVRELENCVERTATMANEEVISEQAFPCQGNRCLTQVLHNFDREDAVRPGPHPMSTIPIDIPVVERTLLPEQLQASRGMVLPADSMELPAYGGVEPKATQAETVSAVVERDIPLHSTSIPIEESVPRVEPSVSDKPEGERERLIWAMERCGWVQAKAARLLKITPRQMGYALRKYEIEVRRF